jgi:hypothetical protein
LNILGTRIEASVLSSQNQGVTLPKAKMVPSAMVDIEEIKRQVRIQLLGDFRPIFESQGLPMPNIGAVGNQEEHRSSLAYIAVAPNIELADLVPAGCVP